MQSFPPRKTNLKTFMAVALVGLFVCLAIGATVRSLDKTNWKQWTKSDVHRILSKSPWVSNCCRTWLGGGETIPPDAGYTAVIMSSHTVREALVRNVQLDKRYEKLDPAHRQEIDQRADACLDERFDDYIVFSFSLLGNSPAGPTSKDKFFVSNLYVVTSDGRKIPGHLTTTSVAMTCGAFARDTELASLWPLWSDLTPPWWPLGPGKEVSFPRFVDGKPTIAPGDRTIQVSLHSYKGYKGPARSNDMNFSIDKLTYKGQPDF